MTTLTYGEIPANLTIDAPYDIWLVAEDEHAICEAINQGIDSHLEAVQFTDHGIKDNKHHLSISDSASMRCLLRRMMENENENANDLASCIMETLDYEWV